MGNIQRRYYLGASVTDISVLSRIQKYSDRIRGLFGTDCKICLKQHLTIIPPFYTNEKNANKIIRGCNASAIISNHPIVKTIFEITGMQILSLNNIDIVCFPIRFQSGNNLEVYLQALKQKLIGWGITFHQDLINVNVIYISILVKDNIKNDVRLKFIVNESNKLEPLFFKSGYVELYEKYLTSEWQTASGENLF